MRYSLLVISLLLLSGCKSTSGLDASNYVSELENKEKIFKATNNTEKLIEFYKQELKRNDSEQYRIKLANSYLSILDPESALFVMEPVLNRKNVSFASAIVAAKAYLDLGDDQSAQRVLEDARAVNPDDGEVYNLLGIIYANKGQWQMSRQMFEQARANFYDDIKVKNNLALIDMIEGDENQALKRISSLTADQLDDEKIHSNLLLIMAKNGHKDYVMEALGPRLSMMQKTQIYHVLRNSAHAEAAQETMLPNSSRSTEAHLPVNLPVDTVSSDEKAEEQLLDSAASSDNLTQPLDQISESDDVVIASDVHSAAEKKLKPSSDQELEESL